MNKLQEIANHLRSGQVYRRADLMLHTKAVDRHLKQLLRHKKLLKLSAGLYYTPKRTAFGDAPPSDEKLIASFLKDERFLITSRNAYNSLGLGATQLYNETVVYNHKRHGHFKLGERLFDFRVKPCFPKTLSKEFLFVDLVNNLDTVAEDKEALLVALHQKIKDLNKTTLMKNIRLYGNLKSRKFFSKVFSNGK